MAVGYTQRQVGVGEEIAVGEHGHLSFDIGAHQAVDVVAGRSVDVTLVSIVCMGVSHVEEIDSRHTSRDDLDVVFCVVGAKKLVVFFLVVEYGVVV